MRQWLGKHQEGPTHMLCTTWGSDCSAPTATRPGSASRSSGVRSLFRILSPRCHRVVRRKGELVG